MFRFKKTSSLFERDFLIDQVSHPYKSRFMGMAGNNTVEHKLDELQQCRVGACIAWIKD
jgi:hypothetical protein